MGRVKIGQTRTVAQKNWSGWKNEKIKKKNSLVFILKWPVYPYGGDETRFRTRGLDYVRLYQIKTVLQIIVKVLLSAPVVSAPELCHFLTNPIQSLIDSLSLPSCRTALKSEGSLLEQPAGLTDPTFRMFSSGASFSSFLLLSCLPSSRSSSSAITFPQRYRASPSH